MKKYYDEDDDTYFDGEDKKPRIFRIILIILIIGIIIFLLVNSCGKTTKSSNNYLNSLRVSNSKMSPSFKKDVYNYDVTSISDTIVVSCEQESSKAKTNGCNTRLNIREGEKITHKVTVTAEDKSTKTYTLNISKEKEIEEEKHTVSIESNVKSGETTSKEIVLEAIVDVKSNDYSYQWYKDDEKIENATSNKYVATTSGEYYVAVENKLTNYSVDSNTYEAVIKREETKQEEKKIEDNKYTLAITNISGNPTSWVSSCKLVVSANSSNGLQDKPYSFDGGKTYQAENSKVFTSNQTVNIVVKDVNGNKVTKTVKIEKIDANTPKVSISTSVKSSTSIQLTAIVTPSSTLSGYKYQWYLNDKAISKATSKTYIATSYGNYKVVVKTNAGKSVTSSVYNYSKTSNVSKLTCPKLTVTTESGGYIDQKTWTTENVVLLIQPDSNTVFYDIYTNESNIYNSISEKYIYFDTYTKPIKFRLAEKGMRVVKIVVRDNFNNSKDCYSKVYYLK